MNADKAREFFSSYHEGTLEGGLKQTFEQKLKVDPEVRRDYESFVEAMEALDSLKFEEIPVPLYLNARIHDRIDEARKPAKEKRGLVFYLPRLGLAAAAGFAIVSAGMAVLSHSRGGAVAPAGLGPVNMTEDNPPSESIRVESKGNLVEVGYSSATDRVVTVLDENGSIARQDSLKSNERFTSELKNPNSQAALFEVKVSDSGPDEYIVVPGLVRVQTASAQSGSVLEFEKALANRYGKAVIFAGKDPKTPMNWNLTQSDVNSALDTALTGAPLVESITSDNVISIADRD